VAKAKEMRSWVEKVFHLARKPDTHNAHRRVRMILFENKVQSRLFKELLPRYE
jgi:ribosomal protein L17